MRGLEAARSLVLTFRVLLGLSYPGTEGGRDWKAEEEGMGFVLIFVGQSWVW